MPVSKRDSLVYQRDIIPAKPILWWTNSFLRLLETYLLFIRIHNSTFSFAIKKKINVSQNNKWHISETFTAKITFNVMSIMNNGCCILVYSYLCSFTVQGAFLKVILWYLERGITVDWMQKLNHLQKCPIECIFVTDSCILYICTSTSSCILHEHSRH